MTQSWPLAMPSGHGKKKRCEDQSVRAETLPDPHPASQQQSSLRGDPHDECRAVGQQREGHEKSRVKCRAHERNQRVELRENLPFAGELNCGIVQFGEAAFVGQRSASVYIQEVVGTGAGQ